jgi:adenylate cyclase
LALSVNQKRKLQQTRVLLIVGTLLGPFYALFSESFSFEELHPYLNGAVIGLLISLFVALMEIWWLDKGTKHFPFSILVFLRTIIYIVSITIIATNVFIISRMIRIDLTYSAVLKSKGWQDYVYEQDFFIVLIYALFLALSVNFIRMLSRKMGQGMLVSQVTGTYYTPVKQERIIMFMNVANSSEIAEKLEPMDFHKFLNNLFYDITEPIISNGGIIYEYVEDLVVITWSMNKGIRNSNCLRTFFDIVDKLEGVKEKYYTKFGLFPNLRGSIHCGKVVRAEIGDVKTQIVLHGDVMNTTARILDKCYELDKVILASAHLVYRLELPKMFECESVGHIGLKGKEKDVELFNIHEKTPATI